MGSKKEEICFKLASSKKARRGTIIEQQNGGYLIQCKRTSAKFKAQVVFVDSEFVRNIPDKPAKPSTDFDTLCRQRAIIGYQRLGINEGEVLQHPAVLRMAKSVLSLLAWKNGRDGNYIIQDGSLRNHDHVSMELYSDYAFSLLIALRRETFQAPQSDLEEFRDHLDGKRSDSRIFATITFAGRGAAIRAAMRTNKGADISYDLAVDDYMAIVPHVENDVNRWAEMKHGIASALRQIRHIDRTGVKIILTKFALGSGRLVPLSNAEVAKLLNRQRIEPLSGRTWTRNTVGTRVKMTLDTIRQQAGNLEGFWKEDVSL